MTDDQQREFAYEVLGQLTAQVADETGANAMMAGLLAVLGTWLQTAHRQGYPAEALRGDVMIMLDKALGPVRPENLQ